MKANPNESDASLFYIMSSSPESNSPDIVVDPKQRNRDLMAIILTWRCSGLLIFVTVSFLFMALFLVFFVLGIIVPHAALLWVLSIIFFLVHFLIILGVFLSTKIQLKRIKQIHEDVFSNPDCPIHKDWKKLSDILKSTLIINFIPIIGIWLMIPAWIKFSQKIQELQWSFEPLYTEMNLKRQQAFMWGHGRIGGFGLGRGFGGCWGRGFGGTGLL